MPKRGIPQIIAVVFAACQIGIGPAGGRADPSRGPTLTGVHHSIASDRTRVVLDLSSQTGYDVRSYEKPDRVAVNLRGVRTQDAIAATDIAEGVVRKIRVNRLSWGTQVVFDLRRAATWSDHYLQPMDGMPGRIVIDVLGPETSAPGASGPKTAAPSSVPSREPAAPRTQDQITRKTTEDGASPGRVLVVAVDAGHGGKDSGAKGGKSLVEKTLVLDIARRVAASIDRTSGFKAVLTRDGDVFLDLVERTRIAKKKKADIFVSIHLNSAPRKTARGAEVFFISPAGADAAARRLLSNQKATARELGIDEPRSDDILHMLVNLNQQSMMQRSFLLAEELLKAADRPGLPPVRSVKQQSFAVLKSIDMPSVLVEAGFLTNAQDAAIVKSPKGRQAVAEAIAAGAVSFLKKYPPSADARGPAIARKVHTVKPGETLWAISKRYNTTVASIRRVNGLGDADVLRVGQELVIREGHDGR